MMKSKVAVLVFLCVASLVAVVVPVQSQSSSDSVYILSDGSIYSSTNATVPIQKEGNTYTFTDNLDTSILVVQRGGITIDGAGYAIEGGGEAGIMLESVNDVTIENLQINGQFTTGIYLAESSFNTITGNTIKNNRNGIFIFNCTQNVITDNTIIDNEIGVDLSWTTDNQFRNNNLDNLYNIAVYGSDLAHYVHDFDESNTIDSDKKVYYLVGQENIAITPETFPDVGFLALVSCTNITVQNIELTSSVQGIVLAGTTGSKILQSSMTANYYGIMLFSSSNNFVSGNTITNNVRGVQLSRFSTANSISANNITDNTGGMFLYNSSQNTIQGNYIANNEDYGVGFSASSFNLVRGNYFLDNEIQVVDPSDIDSTIPVSINTWSVSYPAGGNYWSDFTGIDVKSGVGQDEDGGDGIGDTAYIINSNNRDEYPLILEGSYTVYITSPTNTTYDVNSITLTYVVSESDSVISYSLDDQANVTISGSTTLSNLSEGTHELTVFAEGSEDNQSSHTVYFTITEEAESPTNNGEPEPLPITLIATIIVAVAVVGVVLLYFMKIRK